MPSDPLERLRRIRAELVELEQRHLAERTELLRARAAAVRELLDQGYSLADVAAELGVTRQRVHAFTRE